MGFWQKQGSKLALAKIERQHANAHKARERDAREKEHRDIMGFFQDLRNQFKGMGVQKDAAVGTELYAATDGWGISAAGVPVNAFSSLQHVAVMACVSILSEDIAKVPVWMFRRLPNGGKEVVKDHYLSKLLKKPNNWQTRFEFIEMMMYALLLRGNAYACIIRDERGRPQQLIPVHPDRVTLYEAPGGEYFFFVTRQGLHETAVLSSLPLMVAQEDIFHIRWLSTWSSLLGTSRIGLMREAVGLGMGLEQHQARLVGQGARPGGVLTTDAKLNPETSARIKADWQQKFSGFRNSGLTPILEQGLEFKPITMTNTDAEFMANRQFQLEDICRAFRVPRHKIGLPVEGAASGLVQYDQAYLNDTLSSYFDRWTLKFEELGDLDGDDIFVEFDYEHFLKADIKTRIDAKTTAVMRMGVTPNEFRRSEGLPAVPFGDVVYQQQNMVPLGTPPQAKEGSDAGIGSDTTGKPAPGGDGDPNGKPIPGDSAESNG